jgi:hypothetical protein
MSTYILQGASRATVAAMTEAEEAFENARALAVAAAAASDVTVVYNDSQHPPPPASLHELVWLLRRSPRSVQLALVERVQQHYLTHKAVGVAGRVVAFPPIALVGRTAGRALRLAQRGRDRVTAFRLRLIDATIGRVQRSLPYRCAVAYATAILADAKVAIQLHTDAARDIPSIHSSSFISSTPASCSLSPLSPGASKLTAIGWRTRRFVYAFARFTGQSRRHLFQRSLRHWPLDALTLWFQLLLLFLPAEDASYEAVRESLIDCLRWYEMNNQSTQFGVNGASSLKSIGSAIEESGGQLLITSGDTQGGGYGKNNNTSYHSSLSRVQVEGQRSTDSFLADLCSPADSASPIRLPRARPTPLSPSNNSGGDDAVVTPSSSFSPLSAHIIGGTGSSTLRRPRASTLNTPSEIDFSSNVGTPAFSPIKPMPMLLQQMMLPSPMQSVSQPPVRQQYATSAAAVAAAVARANAAAATSAAAAAAAAAAPSPRKPHTRAATSNMANLAASLRSNASAHSSSMSMSFDSSNSQVLYSRALDLIARAGIDLADVSMDDSLNEAGPLGMNGVGAGVDTAEELENLNESAWDPLASAGAREIISQGNATDTDCDSGLPSAFNSGRGAVHTRVSSVHHHMSMGELDGAELQPGGAGFISPEGRQRVRKELFPPVTDTTDSNEVAATATAVAPKTGISAEPRPRLLLPLSVHISTRCLNATQTLLISLHPLLSHLCTSHAIELRLMNPELRSWNKELSLGQRRLSSKAGTVNTSEDVCAPPLHLIVHDLSSGDDDSSIPHLLSILSNLSQNQKVLVAQSYFLVLLLPQHSSILNNSEEEPTATAVSMLTPYASQHPLLQSLLTQPQHIIGLHSSSTTQDSANSNISLLTDDLTQQERLLHLADRVLQVAEQSLLDMSA